VAEADLENNKIAAGAWRRAILLLTVSEGDRAERDGPGCESPVPIANSSGPAENHLLSRISRS
jgi:hypothetical protein